MQVTEMRSNNAFRHMFLIITLLIQKTFNVDIRISMLPVCPSKNMRKKVTF